MIHQQKRISGIKSLLRGLEGLLEVGLLTALYYFVCLRYYPAAAAMDYFAYSRYVLVGVYAVLLIALFAGMEGFHFGYSKLTDVLLCQWIGLLLAAVVSYGQLCLMARQVLPVMPMVGLLGVEAVAAFCFCFLYTWLYHKIYVPKNMVMIYGREDAMTLKRKMEARPDKYHVRKLLSVEEGLESILRQLKDFDAVIINDVPAEIRNDLVKHCYRNGIRAYVTPKITDIVLRGSQDITLFDTPLLLVKGYGLTPMQRFWKRLLDMTLSALALVLLSPVLLLVALAIKLEDGGPVFYRQDRVSLDGKVFSILKFRSMIVDAEKNGISVPATDHDPRITKVGRFTRATRIDELPQLINILKGDMSVVGPRPERVEHMEKYGKEIPEFALRLKVKGGLTGYAQIYGKYNTTPYDKLRLDLIYIENYSFLLDIKLILMTLRIMLKKESTEGFEAPTETEETTGAGK